MKNCEAISEILLAGRTHRASSCDTKVIFEVFNDFYNKINEQKPHLVVCNSTENKTCFSLANDQPILIIDCYAFEIMKYLNNIDGTSRFPVARLFFKLYAEHMFFRGNYSTALTYMNKYNAIEPFTINEAENDQMLSIQQVFIVYHEILHYFYYSNKDKLQAEIPLTHNELLEMLEALERTLESKSKTVASGEKWDSLIDYYKEIEMHEYVIEELQAEKRQKIDFYDGIFNPMRDHISKKSYLEESICDKFATIRTLEWGVKMYSQNPVVFMPYICSALNSQFLVSFISSYFNGDLLMDVYSEAEARLYYVYFVIYNYLAENGIFINDVDYEEAFVAESNRITKIFEHIISLSHEEMDRRDYQSSNIKEDEKRKLSLFIRQCL